MLLWLFGKGFSDGITLRAALAGIVAFGVCLLLGPRVIAWLRAKKVVAGCVTVFCGFSTRDGYLST